MPSVLAVDAGTTGATALVIRSDGKVLSRGYAEFAQHFPRPGWVEHEPEEIWQAVLAACREALAATTETPSAVGVTNQRETAVLWNRDGLAAPRRALVWQDRRTAALCDDLRRAGHEDEVVRRTGLRLDPYFTATKLRWLAENEKPLWDRVSGGDITVGTVDSYVIARMSGGTATVTDASNASRTLLFDLTTGAWSPELCDLFGVPIDALPEIVDSSGVVATTDPRAFLGLEIPVAGIAGDQQAALFGQTCFTAGSSKCTYGTGSFVLVNAGDAVPAERHSDAGVLTTVAWRIGGTTTYALEGAIFVTGAAVQWLRDGLGLISSAAEVEALARTVPDSGGVVFVPALSGLGAPRWDPDARGLIVGITRGTTRAHIARATLEAIAFQVRDVVDALTAAAGVELPALTVDGGASANALLCQLQADQLGVPVRRPVVRDTTALGAGFLAGLGTGVWTSLEDLRETWSLDAEFAPAGRDDDGYAAWQRAVERSAGWAAG